jgi:hypothetical protein
MKSTPRNILLTLFLVLAVALAACAPLPRRSLLPLNQPRPPLKNRLLPPPRNLPLTPALHWSLAAQSTAN